MIKRRSVLSHLFSSYDIPKEVIPSATNINVILKYILRKSTASLVGVKHALQVNLSIYQLSNDFYEDYDVKKWTKGKVIKAVLMSM